MTDHVIGIDSGSSTVKVTLHDVDGTLLAAAAEPTPVSHPWPGSVERHPLAHWAAVVRGVSRLLHDSGTKPEAVVAIGLAGHGDGVHLVDAQGEPVGPALLSQDTRAGGVIERWDDDGTLAALREITGQVPFPGSQAPLLRWLDDHDPDRLVRARWVLAAKDWLRLRMTGEVATDRTDAGGSFADLDDHAYSAAALEVTGLGHLAHLLPPALEPTAVAGHLLPAAATELGLQPGLPVSTGLHDVAATVLGSVGAAPGQLCVIAGTFGVNVVLVEHPVRAPLLNTRPGPFPGTWTVRRTARGSGASVAWAAQALLGEGGSARDALDVAFGHEPAHDPPLFVPFVFGGTGDQPGHGSFLDLHSWHGREEMLRGVVECVAFNHCHDVAIIREVVSAGSVHLAGGLTRDTRWNQLLADALEEDVTCAPGDDAGARGAAATAVVVSGHYPDLASAAEPFRAPAQRIEPRASNSRLRRNLNRYREALAAAAVARPAPPRTPLVPPIRQGLEI
ncbi:FGGY-family carbohydrate kinase [Pseudactinotalea sp.]|uniref:FGGY-family carbohydrate kinase n=1 Tax=Pseudactinotalea sp. TaxID=1926260 RepID=UPI003B3B48BE